MFKQKIKLIIYVLLIVGFTDLNADYFRIYLKDKGPGEFATNTELYLKAKNSLSEAALKRRKNAENEPLITYKDVPVYEEYITKIGELAYINLILKWNNYIVVDTDSSTVVQIRNLDFVEEVTPANEKIISKVERIEKIQDTIVYPDKFSDHSGFSKRYLKLLNIDKLHKLGLDGTDVIIGIIDSGFDTEKHNALKNLEVLDTYDFINNQKAVNYNGHGSPDQDVHGSLVLSLIAGVAPGKMLGAAPKAKFILAKTEDITSEKRIEEDNFAAAVEWMESKGVDVVNASLGYYSYDPDQKQYSYADMDGNTAISTLSVNYAVERGVIFVTSAGNTGPKFRTLAAPGDSPLAITVGAMQGDYLKLTDFSSKGPNAAGVLKPDIIAPGFSLIAAHPGDTNSYIFDSGTSFSSPLIAGGMALLVQASNSTKKIDVIKSVLYGTGSNTVKDSSGGWGLPDFKKAQQILSGGPTSLNYINIGNFKRIFTYFEVSDRHYVNYITMKYRSSDGTIDSTAKMYAGIIDNQYYYDIPNKMWEDHDSLTIVSIVNEEFNQNISLNDSYVSPVIPPEDIPYYLPKELLVIEPNIVSPHIQSIKIKTPINTEESGFVKISIYDVYGKKHKEIIDGYRLGYNDLIINVSSLSSGKYIVVYETVTFDAAMCCDDSWGYHLTGSFVIAR